MYFDLSRPSLTFHFRPVLRFPRSTTFGHCVCSRSFLVTENVALLRM
jgi:hypothetical protein